MSVITVGCRQAEGLRMLTREEIDRRLRRVGSVVTRTEGLSAIAGDEATLAPRWITAAELVRRVRPFLSCN